MTDYGKTRSTINPKPLKFDEFSVWVHSNIKPVKEENGETEFDGFEFDMVQYDKDEYILSIAESTADVEKQLTNTQLALCELFERMVV